MLDLPLFMQDDIIYSFWCILFLDNTTDSSSCDPPYEYGYSKIMDDYPNYLAALIIFFSSIANILVLRGVKLTKQRPLSYYFIANIALVELIDSLLVPFKLHYYTRPWLWIFGKVMCTTVFSAATVFALVVSFTLAAFSVYACCILLYPKRRQSHVYTVFKVLAIVWLISIALTIPFSLTAIHKPEEICNVGTSYICIFMSDDPIHDQYVTMAHMICQMAVPFAVVILSYGFLLFYVKILLFRSRRTHSESHSETVEMSDFPNKSTTSRTCQAEIRVKSISSTSDSNGNGSRKDSAKLLKMESKLLRMILWMVIVFVVCVAPDRLVYYGATQKWFIKVKVSTLFIRKNTNLLLLLSKLIHPICFGWSSGIIARNFVPCMWTKNK